MSSSLLWRLMTWIPFSPHYRGNCWSGKTLLRLADVSDNTSNLNVTKHAQYVKQSQGLYLPGTETSFCNSVFSLVISLQSWMSSILGFKKKKTWIGILQEVSYESLFKKTLAEITNFLFYFISWQRSNFYLKYTLSSDWNCASVSNKNTVDNSEVSEFISFPLWVNHSWQ